MLKSLIKACFFAVCLSLVASVASAQEMIHALTGTVTSINPATRMIEVDTDDGSSGHFQWQKKANTSYNFDKNVRADSVEPDKFTQSGAHVIVYYFGQGDVRTVVALRDLGNAPVNEIRGTVAKLNRHDHTLIIQNNTGAEKLFSIDPKTVGDTATGVAQDYKYDFYKGDPVRVAVQKTDGSQTAVLIAPYM